MPVQRHLFMMMVMVGLGLLVTGLLWIATPAPAAAQCGSQASSCKNCHEVNQKYPVNTSGDWHGQHAFGDFCQFCHGGNVQSLDPAVAHADMFYPLADPGVSCAACHPTDFEQKAQVHADLLGVTLVSGSAGSVNDAAASNLIATQIYAAPPLGRDEDVVLLDYNRRYERDVLGHKDPPDWKNGILAGLAIVLSGVSGLVLWRLEGLGRTIHELRESPFLVGDPEAPKPAAPAAIPGLDRPVSDRDLNDEHSSHQ